LTIGSGGIKRTAVAASLRTLRNDGVRTRCYGRTASASVVAQANQALPRALISAMNLHLPNREYSPTW